ncbi:MAG: helix-turn-helix transcriptional regulator [Lachnospiraceae bacterium]|nr:helix-turn-helix transcriptional regulator [Lachnospiraceae bacterium]
MSIGSRIKELRENKNISRNDFATMIGVTVGAISNYENDVSSPKEPILFKIIEALECEPNYIFQDMVKIKNQNNDVTIAEYEHIKKYRFISTHSPNGASVVDTVLDREYSIATQSKEQSDYIKKLEASDVSGKEPSVDMRLINYYYRVASAGTGHIIFDMPPTKRIEIPDTPEYRKVDYAIGVNGNSMVPLYSDGDILLVEMTEDIEVGDIGIFRVNNESYVKKLGEIELISLNPTAKNIALNESARCMGKVIGKMPND